MKMAYIVGYASRSFKDCGVRGIPHAFLIGPTGKILWHGHPMNPAMKKTIEEALDAAVR